MVIITLTSDFGLFDPYVAEMKGVILSICPKVRIVDISHGVNKFDIHMGAFILARTTPFFPAKTIHVAVVDPGVGSERRPIIIQTKRNIYVGPDNGILMLSAQREGIENIFVISNQRYMLSLSNTFHGRDIFSCAAAYLANGIHPSEFGSEIGNPVPIIIQKPILRDRFLIGEIIHVDNYGNLVTNILSDNVKKIVNGDLIVVFIKGKTFNLKVCASYSDVKYGRPLLIFGSSGHLEISINRGNASNELGVKKGDSIQLIKTVEKMSY